MNKNEIIKEIELTEEKLKALREKLEAPELPAMGDILEADHQICIVMRGGKNLILDGMDSGGIGSYTVEELIRAGYKNIGTFNEVFMRRDEVRYGYTDDGKEIVAPEGWEIVPEGELIKEGDEAWGGMQAWGIPACRQDFGEPAGVFMGIRAYARRKSPIAEGHNPDGLTEEQVGTKEGWKLLPESFAGKKIDKSLVELWAKGDEKWSGYPSAYQEAYCDNTYRTKADLRDVLKEPEDEFEEWINRIEERNREMAREAYELGRRSASSSQ